MIAKLEFQLDDFDDRQDILNCYSLNIDELIS